MFLVHPSHCLPFLLPFPSLLPLPFRVFSLRLGAELANVIILQGFQVFGNNKRLFSLSPACTQTTMLLAGRFSLRHRRIESDAERCCGRDRCHSGGFLLRIMPPSWHPVPAFVNHDMPQAGHSSLQRRRIESDADLVAATTSAGGTILFRGNDSQVWA